MQFTRPRLGLGSLAVAVPLLFATCSDRSALLPGAGSDVPRPQASADFEAAIPASVAGASYYTDFGADATRQKPSGWSEPYGVTSYTVEEAAGTTGGKVLFNSLATNQVQVLRWDTPGPHLDVDLQTAGGVHRSSKYNEGFGLLARGSADSQTFYTTYLRSSSWELLKYVNGTPTVLATTPNPFAKGTGVQQRFRVEGTTLKAKFWEAGTSEPTQWTLEIVDANPLPAGFAGVFMRRSGTMNAFDWVRATALGGTPPPSNQPPVARVGGPYSGREGTAVAFDGSGSSDPDGDAITHSWSFGDGNSGTGVKPSHTYRDNGSYTVILTVTDPHGAASSDTTTASITNVAPTVSLSADPSSAAVGETVTVTGTIADPGVDDAPWAIRLRWGDGTTVNLTATDQSQPITQTRSYSAEGTYPVEFRVTDKNGGRTTARQTVTVTAGGAPGVAWVWSGGQTAAGATVKTRLIGASSNVRLRVSADSLFRTYTESAPASTAGNDVATLTLSGLAANTRYHYRVVVAGREDAAKQGAFHTLPAVGSAHSFSFALGSCQRTGTNTAVFTHVRAMNPLFWLQTGDIHYRNIATNDINLFREAYNNLHEQTNQAALFRSTSIVHVWDDHDGAGGNDTDGTKPEWSVVREAYRENLPHHALPAGPGGAIYHSFVVGRVRFIVSDLRSERSPKSRTDDGNKTMLGAAQKQYLKDQLAAAKANGQFIAWVSTIPWIAARTSGADHWGGYDTERREIAAYIQSLGVGGQMFQLSGDMHATAIDSGVNNAWGGFAVFNAAPIDQSSSTKGGPYSHGPFTNGSTGDQFGRVTITDNGGSSIQVTFSGRRNGTEIPGAYHQFTLTLK